MSMFGSLLTIVCSNLGGRNDPDTQAQVMFAMNFVQKILASSHEWLELQKIATPDTVAGQYEYTEAELALITPQRIYEISVYDGTRWRAPMTELPEIRWRTECAPSVSLGNTYPMYFSRFAGKFYFSRTPADVYPLRIGYYQKVAKITGVNSVISFEDKDELLIALTTAVTWLAVGEESLFQKWLAFATPLIESFNIDSNRIMNQINPNQRRASQGSPWLDPFARRSR